MRCSNRWRIGWFGAANLDEGGVAHARIEASTRPPFKPYI
jgi:hypothetical protein